MAKYDKIHQSTMVIYGAKNILHRAILYCVPVRMYINLAATAHVNSYVLDPFLCFDMFVMIRVRFGSSSAEGPGDSEGSS